MQEFHVVRSSERAAKRLCRRSWHLGWREGWSPHVVAQALEFGTAVHAGFQAVYEPATWDQTMPSQKLLAALSAFDSCCEEQCDRYLATTGQRRTTWEGRDDYEARIELGHGMLEHYVLNIHPTEDKGIRPVKTEIKFQVPILDENNEPLQCWSTSCGQNHEPGAPVVHEGRVDAIFEDTVHGGLYLVDWKTIGGEGAVDGTQRNTNKFSNPSIVWMHDQLSTYCWALRYRLNRDVRGFILAEIRKDYPKPPALLKRKRNGGVYSTNRNQSTDLRRFEGYVKEHDRDGFNMGAYDEYLEFLAGSEAPLFHKRFRIEKPPAELQEIGENLLAEVREMTAPDVAIYPEPSQISCPRCSFRAPCEMMMRRMDYQYTLNAGFERQLPP